MILLSNLWFNSSGGVDQLVALEGVIASYTFFRFNNNIEVVDGCSASALFIEPCIDYFDGHDQI